MSSKDFEELKKQLGGSLKGNTVTDDMIDRLHEGLPKGAKMVKTFSEGVTLEARLKSIEEATKKLGEQLLDVVNTQAVPEEVAAPVVTQVVNPDNIGLAVKSLSDLVDKFNTDLQAWYETTGCDVNFSWKYNPKKLLDVASIDVAVYRREAPSALTIKEALDAAPTEI